MEVLFLLIGLAAGAVAAYFFMQARSAAALSESENKFSAAQEKAILLERNLNEAKSDAREEISAERSKSERMARELSSVQTMNENLQQKLNEQKAELEQLQQKFSKEFENLANRILDEKTQKFTEQNRTNMDVLLNPFKEKLKEFEQKVDATYKAENAERIVLKTEIKNLIELNKKISDEANNLANALRSDNKTQGNWGELVLSKILEKSGLREGVEYLTQFTTTNHEEERIRPDVVVMLPDSKHIIVDSKVSLVAYSACVNAANEEDRQKFLRGHIESVRSHIKQLGDKKYQTATGMETPDFVLLFLPIESSFSIAVQADEELFNFAWDKKVVIVSPSTLLATLRTIAAMWKQERQTRNALQIAEEGGKLYDKFVSFVEDLIKVGNSIKKSQGDYEEAMKKLHEGSGNLVRRAEKMRELGAKSTKELPLKLVEKANE